MSETDEHDLPLGATEVPWSLVIPEVDIHLVGYGARLPNDFTLETLAVLQRSKRVFGLPPVHAPEFDVPVMEDLVELAGPDQQRDKFFEEMAQIVVAAAVADPPVALATWGSPVVGSYSSHRVIELACERDLTFHVTNAVPLFDEMWADCNVEPFLGLEIWSAATLLRDAIEPNTGAYLHLTHAPLHDPAGGSPEPGLTSLRDHLLRFYPGDHEVFGLTAQPGVGAREIGSGVRSVALRDLDTAGFSHACSLLLPRLERLSLDFERPAWIAAAG
jgi:uncharacterized protein YabN with tetrapyrrole methylase and pyrophosphatase domain